MVGAGISFPSTVPTRKLWFCFEVERDFKCLIRSLIFHELDTRIWLKKHTLLRDSFRFKQSRALCVLKKTFQIASISIRKKVVLSVGWKSYELPSGIRFRLYLLRLDRTPV